MDLQDKSREGRPKGTGCECSCCGAGPPPPPEVPHIPKSDPLPIPLGARPGHSASPHHPGAGGEPGRLALLAPARRYLHVFPQRAGVRVRLVTHLAQIGLIRGVHVHVLLPVATVGEAPVTALELTLEGLLPCGHEHARWLPARPETTTTPPPTPPGTPTSHPTPWPGRGPGLREEKRGATRAWGSLAPSHLTAALLTSYFTFLLG